MRTQFGLKILTKHMNTTSVLLNFEITSFSRLEDYVKLLKDHPYPLQTNKNLEIFNKCGAAEKKRHLSSE